MSSNKNTERIYGVIGLVFMTFFVYLAYEFIVISWSAFSSINPTVGAGMVAATATVIVSVISVLVSKHLEQRAILLKEHRERKTPVYEEMVKLIFRIAFADKLNLPQLKENELIEKMAWFTENLVIWGSDELVLAWNRFRTISVKNQGQAGFEVLFEVERLLLAIRKDLGHSNKGLTSGKVLGLFVNDIESYLV